MKRFGKIILFLSSYIPLFIILIILNINDKGILNAFSYLKNNRISFNTVSYILSTWQLADYFVLILIFLMLLLFVMLIFLVKFTGGYTESIFIKDISDKNKEILDYLLVYILSFVNSNFSDFSRINLKVILAFIILISAIGYLYIINKMIYINPVLHLIFKLNIYQIKTQTSSCIVLSKKNYDEFCRLKGHNVRLNPLGDKIYILK